MSALAGAILLTFNSVVRACNIYDAATLDQTYLCGGQTCNDDGIKSVQCQSGCCFDGKCNDDNKCASRQLYFSLLSMVVVFLVGLVVYFTYWHFRCKKPKS